MLPPIKQVKLPPNDLPTRWQTVIFRNYGMVPHAHLARVLATDEGIIEREAQRLGLAARTSDPLWLTEGYITVIRNNWYLLPYDQLLSLLGFTEERLAFSLENDDFLASKLGKFKPECPPISYAPLTEAQRLRTETLAVRIAALDTSQRQYFRFFPTEDTAGAAAVRRGDSVRLVHGYLTPCGDAFLTDSRTHLPDALLDRYAEQGVNALFVHGVLSALSPYPFAPSLSRDYPIRRRHLRELIARAAQRGIRIYLYLDEPRAVPEEWVGHSVDADMVGHRQGGQAALCLQTEAARNYLYEAVKHLFSDIPQLGGIMTITMSEYFTHCTCGRNTNCPRCGALPVGTVAAQVNNIMMSAIRDSGSPAELIANLWGWSPFLGWTEEQTAHAISLLDPDISVLGVSEYDLAIEKGGVKSRVIDYSISNPGPSEVTRKTLACAAGLGHRIYAKMQVNCSWECSSVPYLPVFDLELEHLRNLSAIGVKDLMLTWTLGGYPSLTYDMVAQYLEDPQGFSTDRWYERQFDANAETVHRAVTLFCRGFRQLPFSLDLLYRSPKNLGPANLWQWDADGRLSTMVCYSCDDYERWIGPYPVEVYLSQMQLLIADWQAGCEVLAEVADTPVTEEMLLFARVALAHFRADMLHTAYAHAKRDRAGNRAQLQALLDEQEQVTRELLALCTRSPLIGYETSNHYFYTERNLIEALLRLEAMREEL